MQHFLLILFHRVLQKEISHLFEERWLFCLLQYEQCFENYHRSSGKTDQRSFFFVALSVKCSAVLLYYSKHQTQKAQERDIASSTVICDKNQSPALDMFWKKRKALFNQSTGSKCMSNFVCSQVVRKLAVINGNVGKLLTAQFFRQ